MSEISFAVLSASQNIGDMYLTVMPASLLFEIAKVDRIRMEELEVPKYAGYQRALAKDRVRSIQDYLSTPRATFPNSIICSIDSEFIEQWEDLDEGLDLSLVTIQRDPGVVQIIDGQHRAAALGEAQEDFDVLVTFFVDLNVEQSAEIFAKINSTQKKVNPSIAFQLFGYSQDRSPQKTAHEIAEVMNNTEGSPFYRQLRMLGTKDEWAIGNLSQSTFAKKLMRLYTRNYEEDQNRILRGEELDRYPGYPLRRYFIEGSDDIILQVVWKYYYNVATTWPEQWDDEGGESVLVKTTGYTAFMQLLRYWMLGDRANEPLNDSGVMKAFSDIAAKYREPDHRFVRKNYPSGNQGVVMLRDSLMEDLGIEK